MLSPKSTEFSSAYLAPVVDKPRETPKAHKIEISVSRERTIRILDVTIAIAAIVFLAPMFIIVCALLKRGDGGPILFKQSRIGKDGKAFVCYKFRSMVLNSEEVLKKHLESNHKAGLEWLVYRKLKNDPRITATGRFLRKTSIDELPQLFNVLKGDMSLVGPRPIMQDEAVKYGRYFANYKAVLPGITGLWQVNGRNNTTYRRRVAIDTVYSRKVSIGLYFGIILKTVPAILLQKGSY